MPKMSGVEACKIIRHEYPGIAVVFVSADDSAEGRAMEAGAKAFLRKPISIPNLVLLISSL